MRQAIRAIRTAASVGLLALPGKDAVAQYIFFGWKIAEMQPNIANGGRANTISVNPGNNNQILVAAETGGLFRSTDRGVTWKHVDGLPEYGMSAVAYLPADTSIVIATVGEDTRVSNGGGIWRSVNGGVTWTQQPGPATPAGVTSRLSAYEISIAPDSGTIYVGTEYGVSVSRDRGATWSALNPYGAASHAVYSVLAQSASHVLAAGPWGIRRSINGGTNWVTPTTGAGGVWDLHALGGSPFANDQAYVVNGATDLYYTEDAGDNWTKITGAPAGGGSCGGIAFVKALGRTIIRPFPPGPLRTLTLYAGNRCWLSTLAAPAIPGTNHFNYSGTWSAVSIDHSDTRDLAFTTTLLFRQPLLLATDGGLHKTTDGGSTWTFSGGGHNGYNALQITEVKGQWITNLSRYDLYFGTQDNNLWTSKDVGSNWINTICCEGFFIELQHRVASAADSKTTFVACYSCSDWLADPLFTGLTLWPDATTPPAGNPKIVRKSFHVQGVDSTATFSSGLASTFNLGASWSQYGIFPETRRDLPKLSDPWFLPVLYQSVRTGWDAARGFEINQLVRIVKRFFGSGAIVTYPLMNNFGGLGINPTMFAWYQVFAVDPGNTRHLIAPDVVNEKMMESSDGGDNWTEIPNLTSQITGAGQFLFRRWIFPEASAISFSPDDPNVVAIGTSQAGLLVSGDRGATWYRVPGSERVTYTTSIEWRSASDAIISTYGRGLWRLRWGLLRPLPDFEHYCRIPCIIRPFPPLGDPIEHYAHAVLVFGGRIEGARVSNRILRELFVSPGSSVVFFSNTRKELDIKVTETNKAVGFAATRVPTVANRLLVGITLGERENLLGGAYAEKTLALYQPNEQEGNVDKEPTGRQASPTAGRPYIRLILPGGSAANTVPAGSVIRIAARDFPPASPVEIAVDDSVVEKLSTGAHGEFVVSIRAPLRVGMHSVTVRDPQTRRVIDGAMFIVKAEDTQKDRRDRSR